MQKRRGAPPPPALEALRRFALALRVQRGGLDTGAVETFLAAEAWNPASKPAA